MEWYRILGAGLLVGSGVWGAYRVNRASLGTLRQIESWLTLLRGVRSEIDCFALPLPVILSRVDRSLLRACGYTGDRSPQSFDEMLRGCVIHDREAERILRRFSEEFGRGYREQESLGCEYCLRLLQERRDRLGEQLPVKKRLCSTLCICVSLALAILLI